METQATKSTIGQKVIAIIMAIVLAVGLCPMLPYGTAPAYADNLVAGQLAAQTDATTPTTLANGTYKVTGLTAQVLHMFHFDADSVTVTINGNQATLNITVSEGNYIKRFDGLAYGPQSKILDASDTTNHTLVAGTPVATVTDTKDTAGNVTARTYALPVEKSVLEAGDPIYYMVKYVAGYSASHDGDWYKASGGDYYFDSYAIWSTDLTVTNNVSMFNVAGAQLSADGEQVRITMGSDSFGQVALCKERKVEEAEIYTITDKVVTLPADELGDGEKITTSWWSNSREAWYERDLTFNAEAKTLTFDTTVKAVDVIDSLGTVEKVKAAIADKSLVVTPELVDDMIAAIQVQYRDDKTDFYCETTKVLWDALSAAEQGEVEEGGYFADDTGDASKDDPLNADGIGENEILVVSFGTSFNDSRVATIGAVEKAIQAAFPEWSVRRAFTAQIIINHIQSRDGEVIDNMDQALERAVANKVKNLIIAPTHLMHGAEYDELVGALDAYKDKMSITISEPLLGEVGATGTDLNADKEAVAKAAADAMAKAAGFADVAAADAANTALVFMGHGTGHSANISYTQMQAQMDKLGYKNVFIGTVEGEPADTECSVVIDKVSAAGYKNVILRPLMVVAGDHANNDMADPEDEESWVSQFTASGKFTSIKCQINGLGEIPAIQQLYVAHVAAQVPGRTIAVPAATAGLTFNGKAQTGVKTGTGYTLSGTTSSTNAGSFTATAKIVSGYVWADGTNVDKTISWSIAKATGKVTVAKAQKFAVKQLKKKAQTFKVAKLTTDGKATYKLTKVAKNKKAMKKKAMKKAFSVNKKNGKVTVKKGLKKGVYTLTVKINAKASTNYNVLKAKAYTVKVTVK